VVLALGDGAVAIGAPIAAQLHCGLVLLLTSEIILSREPVPIGGITADGSMVYNRSYSDGEIDELMTEYRGLVEQEKLTELHNLNRRAGSAINTDRLRRHDVIVVSDGLKTSFPFDLALEFLKPLAMDKLIVATPFASVPAVDRLHVMADDLFCLNVLPDYIDTNHYYDTQDDMPDHDTALGIADHISLSWQSASQPQSQA
jgi:putative phosphoribosyl transferase